MKKYIKPESEKISMEISQLICLSNGGIVLDENEEDIIIGGEIDEGAMYSKRRNSIWDE